MRGATRWFGISPGCRKLDNDLAAPSRAPCSPSSSIAAHSAEVVKMSNKIMSNTEKVTVEKAYFDALLRSKFTS
jgi:hypothetical protein